MKPDYIIISISSNDLGKRIDVLISEKLEHISRSRVKKLILNGNVRFNQKVISDQSFKLNQIGKIEFTIPPIKEMKIKPQNMNLEIIYEDKSLIIVNKQPGTVVHPAVGNFDNTLVNGLLFHCKGSLSGIGGVQRPGIVHRIDKMTSGILLVAKNDYTHNKLATQFKNRTILKEYRALCWNSLHKSKDTIETNISRSKYNRKKMSVCQPEKGKIAITEYELIEEFLINDEIKISYINCKLHTGRTHQIRVHMSFIGNPLIGDNLYKKKQFKKIPNKIDNIISKYFISLNRHALHAKSIKFIHPEKKKELFFDSEIPSDFKKILLNLKKFN